MVIGVLVVDAASSDVVGEGLEDPGSAEVTSADPAKDGVEAEDDAMERRAVEASLASLIA